MEEDAGVEKVALGVKVTRADPDGETGGESLYNGEVDAAGELLPPVVAVPSGAVSEGVAETLVESHSERVLTKEGEPLFDIEALSTAVWEDPADGTELVVAASGELDALSLKQGEPLSLNPNEGVATVEEEKEPELESVGVGAPETVAAGESPGRGDTLESADDSGAAEALKRAEGALKREGAAEREAVGLQTQGAQLAPTSGEGEIVEDAVDATVAVVLFSRADGAKNCVSMLGVLTQQALLSSP